MALHLRELMACVCLMLLTATVSADDWPRFLGAGGDGTSNDSKVPTEWSADKNIAWTAKLPGPGASSPIVVGDRIFLTCYTGYGDGSKGKIADLKRHLFCFHRKDGKVQWQKTIDNSEVKNEDPYKSFIQQHGYATHTPVSDGKNVYAFFGKPGVIAFDLEGKELWRKPIESNINKTRFGSGASPILHNDQLIINAVEECGKIFSLDKSDGSTQWEFDTKATLAYATPNFVKTAKGEMELVVAVPEKIIGLDPKTGKEKWFAKNKLLNEVNGSVMVDGDVVYVYGGFRGVGSQAVRAGGSGDVTESHVLWNSRDTSYVATPVFRDGHIYWIGHKGIANCVNAKTGERIYKTRVPGVKGGRGDVKFFASMIAVGDRYYALSRQSGIFIMDASPEYKLIKQNKIEGDASEFNGTPAIVDNEIFLRSNTNLYCIRTESTSKPESE